MTAKHPCNDLQGLHVQIASLLRRHPQGISEFALLKALQSGAAECFEARIFQDSYSLFQAHFLLFHALYRLDGELRQSSGESLEIDALNIRLQTGSADQGRLPAKPEPLREYYGDLSNLQQTSADDVEQLLGAFWVRYYANERRNEALSLLGLCDPVDMETITCRYRQLAMQHHPDRGGEPGEFEKLQEAMRVLRRC